MEKIDWKEIQKRSISIILTAAIAAGLAFLQSMASHAGLTCTPATSTATAGTLGLIARGGLEILT